MYALRISDYFQQNPKSLSQFNMVKSSRFVSFVIFDMFRINEQRACIKFYLKIAKKRNENVHND